MATSSLPGVRQGLNVTPNDVLFDKSAVRYGRGVIDAANAYDGSYTGYETFLRAGLVMGRDATSKLWAPLKRTRANGAGSGSATLVVDNASSFKAGDSLTIGSTSGVILSIVYATNTITLTATKTWSDRDAVFVAGGFGTARGILNEAVYLRDDDGVARNKPFGQMVIAGLVNPNKIYNDIASARADTGNFITFIQFADDAGQL